MLEYSIKPNARHIRNSYIVFVFTVTGKSVDLLALSIFIEIVFIEILMPVTQYYVFFLLNSDIALDHHIEAPCKSNQQKSSWR